MCRSSNLNYALQAPIDASAIGVSCSEVMESLTSTLSTALQDVKDHTPTSNGNNNSSRKQNSRHPHIVVEHHYHDHANDDDSIDERPARGGVTTPFPIRLHKMLDKIEADGHGDVISWQPHGRCFVVRKPKEFKELLPTYFKLSKMASFQRQLNLYGFQRLTRGRDKNGYYHEYFLRGKPALSHKIQRTKVKGTGVRARSSPATEPHLWEMAWVGTGNDHQQAEAHHVSDAGSVSTQEDESDFATPKPSPAPVFKQEPRAVAAVNSSMVMASLPPPPSTASAMASMPPLVSPTSWSQQQQQLYAAQQQRMRDEISLFGKTFHYLDPREMMKEAELRKRQYEACQRDDMQAFMSNLELDNLYSELDDDNVDNDDAFMDMLERVIE